MYRHADMWDKRGQYSLMYRSVMAGNTASEDREPWLFNMAVQVSLLNRFLHPPRGIEHF